MDYIYGELNNRLDKVKTEYKGKITSTAEVVVDNENEEIEVNVKKVPHKLVVNHYDKDGNLTGVVEFDGEQSAIVNLQDIDSEAIYDAIDEEASAREQADNNRYTKNETYTKEEVNNLVEESIKHIEVSDVKALNDEQCEKLSCGDVVVKVDSTGKHSYRVTYKKANVGMCLTYSDALYGETVAYDFIEGHWVYNSMDSMEFQPKLESGTNIKTINNESLLGSGNITLQVEQEQADWNESDTTALDYIKNKPTTLSQFTNDSGFITNAVNDLTNYYLKSETYTKDEVNQIVANFGSFEVVPVLPTEDIKTNVIYLVPKPAQDGIYYFKSYSEDTSVYHGKGTVQLTGVVSGDYSEVEVLTNIPVDQEAPDFVGQKFYMLTDTIPNTDEFIQLYDDNLNEIPLKVQVYTYDFDNPENIYLEYIYVSNNWELIGSTEIDLSGYQEKLVSGTNIKTINGQSILDSGNLAIKTNNPFGDSWVTNSTTGAFCDSIVNDGSAIAGMSYLGQLSCSDLPGGLIQGEAIVEVISNNANGKAIHITITSVEVSPYHWEYERAKVNGTYITQGWVAYQPELTNNSVSSGTLDKVIGFDSQGNLVKGNAGSGVVVNPTMTSLDPKLKTIDIDGTYYNISNDKYDIVTVELSTQTVSELYEAGYKVTDEVSGVTTSYLTGTASTGNATLTFLIRIIQTSTTYTVGIVVTAMSNIEAIYKGASGDTVLMALAQQTKDGYVANEIEIDTEDAPNDYTPFVLKFNNGKLESAPVDQTYDAVSKNPQSGVAVAGAVSGKQDTLVSGTNIKTVNNESLLGSGNISITASQADWSQTDTSEGSYILNKPRVDGTFTNNWTRDTSITINYGQNVWTDGTNIYHSYNVSHYVWNIKTRHWDTKSWTGLTSFFGSNVWTDGDNIYYSSSTNQYVLDKSTSTWSVKSWTGLTSFDGDYIWECDGTYYYSYASNHYVLNKATSTWSQKTWTGLTSFYGNRVWKDRDNIYYSSSSTQYVLNKATSTWSTKTWIGTSFTGYGNGIWTDGNYIYYSYDGTNYVMNSNHTGWNYKYWTGLNDFRGYNIWSDGVNIYYSSTITYALDNDYLSRMAKVGYTGDYNDLLNKPEGMTPYVAGNGISIENGVISLDIANGDSEGF